MFNFKKEKAMGKFIIVFALVSVFVCGWDFEAVAAQKPTCAVLTFDVNYGLTKGEANMISDRFAADLSKYDRFAILDRSKIQLVINKLELSTSTDYTDLNYAIKLGKLLDVKYVICGSIAKHKRFYTLNTRLINVDTTESIKTATSDYEGDFKNLIQNVISNNVEVLLGIKSDDNNKGQRTLDTASTKSQKDSEKVLSQKKTKSRWLVPVAAIAGVGGIVAAAVAVAGGGGGGGGDGGGGNATVTIQWFDSGGIKDDVFQIICAGRDLGTNPVGGNGAKQLKLTSGSSYDLKIVFSSGDNRGEYGVSLSGALFVGGSSSKEGYLYNIGESHSYTIVVQ